MADSIDPSRVHLARRVTKFARNTAKGARVLDVGAGPSPYRSLFKHARYETSGPDVAAIPVEDSHFDRVLCTQTLEHRPDPDRVLAELFRVVKPGGRVFCSVPLFLAEHAGPMDLHRYTQFALRRLFEHAGFEVISLTWLEGYFGTVSYQFSMMDEALPGDLRAARRMVPGRRGIYLGPLIWLVQRLSGILSREFAHADLRTKYTPKTGMPKNYVVVARRPA